MGGGGGGAGDFTFLKGYHQEEWYRKIEKREKMDTWKEKKERKDRERLKGDDRHQLAGMSAGWPVTEEPSYLDAVKRVYCGFLSNGWWKMLSSKLTRVLESHGRKA